MSTSATRRRSPSAVNYKVQQQHLAETGQLTASTADKHWLYEESVQNAEYEVGFFSRVFKREYGHRPHLLREDFCGTALLSCSWVAARRDHSAVGIDLHGPTLAWGRRHNVAPLGDGSARVTLIQADVRDVQDPPADLLAATNFSWWGFKTREELTRYLSNCRASLRSEGMLVLDCYGGPEAQIPQEEEREMEGFSYIWDQDTFNPISHEIRCLIHFDFPDGSRMQRAFRYDWRLWSLPEVRDLLVDVGFRKTEVYWETADRDGEPSGIYRPSTRGDLAPAWVAYILAYR
jgi:hypothetical protein